MKEFLGIKSKNSSIIYTEKIKEICDPLFGQTEVNLFTYSRVYIDGSRAELWSDSQALLYSFLERKYISDIYTPDLYEVGERYVFLPTKILNFPKLIKIKYSEQLNDLKRIYGYDNCFLVINRNTKFCEYFIFYTPITCIDGINYYINHLTEIENFISSFQFKSEKLIKYVDRNRIIKPWRNFSFQTTSDCDNAYFDNFNTSFLTNREIQTAKLMLQGKTARESACLLGLSLRTVESYIDNIKNKFGCNRKSELILKLAKIYGNLL